MKTIKKYLHPLIILLVFEAVAVTLWLTKNNLFYLFNFSYIGISVSLGVFLYIRKYKNARRVVQLLVGLYMLVYLGLICFGLSTLFQLVTLPVEFDASARAMNCIRSSGILQGEEINSAGKVLRAAAMTYVASLSVSLLQLLRFISIYGGRRRN